VHQLLIVFCLLWQATLLSASESTTSVETKPSWEVGFSLNLLVPNQLPEFVRTVPVYGPMLGIPVGKSDVLQIEAVYGSSERISLFMTEVDYRYHFSTPFIRPYVIAGVGYLHHGFSGNDHNYVMPIAGLGFYFPMVKNFVIAMNMRIYVPKETFLRFSGQFAYLF
jgi:hypothetical protein